MLAYHLVLAGIGIDLGPIGCHMAKFYQPHLLVQQKGLREQPRHNHQMTLAKLRKGIVVWMHVRREFAERDEFTGPHLGLPLAQHGPAVLPFSGTCTIIPEAYAD